MRKWNGCPSPAQNQSKRLQSLVRPERTTSLMYPPRVVLKMKPRFTLVKMVLLTEIFRTPSLFPSLNFTAAEAEESRQLVTEMFSQRRAGPQASVEMNTMQSSPVSIVQLAIRTSLHPSRSMPSAQTDRKSTRLNSSHIPLSR